MSEIGQAFVRIRPNTTGFKAEAESGIKGAFSGIGKLVGATFVIGGVAKAAESVAKAAADQEAELAVVRQAVAQTNAAWIVHGKTVEQVLENQAAATGFTVAELAGSFNRIQTATANTAKTFQLLSAAEDIARAQHRSTAVAALALVRAYQGSSQSLRRFGVVVPQITAEEDKLVAAHQHAIEVGGKFTAAQNILYKQRLEAAKAADKQASSENVLRFTLARFGGEANAFAHTTAGQFARLHETINQFEVSLGHNLLPTLNDAADGLRAFFEGAKDSGILKGDLVGLGTALHSAFQEIGTIATTLGPPLQIIANLVQKVVNSIGGGGILVSVLGYKALGAALGLVASTHAKYLAVLAAGRATSAANVAQNRATTASWMSAAAAVKTTGAAVDSESVALTRNIDAMLASEAAAARLAAAQTALAAKYEVTNIAAFGGGKIIRDAGGQFVTTTRKVEQFGRTTETAGQKLATLGRGLFAMAGGFQTLAAVGVAALVYGLYRLISADTALESANKRLSASEHAYGDELIRTANIKARIAALKESVPVDVTSVATAKLAQDQALQTLAQSKAGKGTLEYRQLLQGSISAIQSYNSAVAQLKKDQDDLTVANANLGSSHRKASREVNQATAAALQAGQAAVDNALQASQQSRVGRLGLRASPNASANAARAAAKAFSEQLDRDAAKEKNAIVKRNEQLLSAAAKGGRLPDKSTIHFILDNRDVKATLGGLLFQLSQITAKGKEKAVQGGKQVGHSLATGAGQGVTDGSGPFNKIVTKFINAGIEAGKSAAGAHSPSQVAREEIGHAISDGIALGILDKNGAVVGALTNQLDNAIASGVATVQQAILSAKQNLNSIGGGLANDIQSIIDKRLAATGSTGKLTGPAATQLARLNKEIASGGSTPELVRAAQALQNQILAQQAKKTTSNDIITGKLADLSDIINRGSITGPQAAKRLHAILKEAGATPAAALKTGPGGIALADQLRADTSGFIAQMKAIIASPKFGGSGLAPQIVKPLDAIKQEQQNIADAAQAQRDKMIAEQKRAVAEAKRHTKLLQKIHAAAVAAHSLDVSLDKQLRGAGLNAKQRAQVEAAVHGHLH